MYVEIENVTNTASGEVAVYFDPAALKCELADVGGKAIAPTPRRRKRRVAGEDAGSGITVTAEGGRPVRARGRDGKVLWEADVIKAAATPVRRRAGRSP